MSNEEYLAVSYWMMAALSALAGCAAWMRLRGPLGRLAGNARRDLVPLVRRLLPAGLILPAIAGFCSVSYRGCIDHENYASIVADRSYLIAKNHAQAREALAYLKWAVVIWCVFAFLLLIVNRIGSSDNSSSGSRTASTRV